MVDRFWAKVLKSDDPDGCWTWIGGRTSQDYGAIRAGGRGSPMIPAHCLSYEIHKGARGDRFVCHSCDNPSCVNPAHLWLGTNSENILDAANKGRAASGRTRHNHVTLNPDAVREIRRRYAAGEKQRDIAAGYGVKQACVWRAIHRFTWRYID